VYIHKSRIVALRRERERERGFEKWRETTG
jgi:hypothetical protein